jgi:hypothetical protein
MDKTAFFNHFVVSRGRLIGGYRKLVEKRVTVIACTLVVKPTADERDALAREADRFGAFLGTPVRLDLRIDPAHQARPTMTARTQATKRAAKSKAPPERLR